MITLPGAGTSCAYNLIPSVFEHLTFGGKAVLFFFPSIFIFSTDDGNVLTPLCCIQASSSSRCQQGKQNFDFACDVVFFDEM